MTVSDVTSSYLSSLGSQTTSTTTEEADPLGRDAFLTMLVAQMKNQDPLNPMDGTDFTAQLAQFSSLEQLFNVNDNLESISSALSPDSESDLVDLIGKNVACDDKTLVLDNGDAEAGSYTLKKTADVFINIYNSDGEKVAQVKAGQKDAGTYKVDWNGLDAEGDLASDGTYSYEVLAYDESNNKVSVDTSLKGTVTAVTYKYDTPYLMVGDRLVDPSTVTKVSLADDEA